MRFFTSSILALLSAPLFAYAQSPNPFSIPTSGLSATGGQPLTLQWKPTTSGTISLILRSGSSNNLQEGAVIVTGYSNSGSYTWVPSNSLTRGSDYTVEIVDDSDPSQTNYTPYFVLDTTTTVSSSMSMVTLGAPSSTPDVSTASPTTTASPTSPSSMQSSAPASTTTVAAGSTGTTMTTATVMSGTTTAASSTASGSAASSAPSSAASDSSASAASGSGSASTSSSAGVAARATAMAGMLGAVALGALAL